MKQRHTPAREPRDQQTNFVMTKDEKERLQIFADRRGMSVSAMVRYLVLKGLATEDEGE